MQLGSASSSLGMDNSASALLGTFKSHYSASSAA